MTTLLLGLFSCLAVQQVFGAPGHSHGHGHNEGDTWKITLHILSGGDRNISWVFPGEKHVEPKRQRLIIRELNIAGHGEHNNETKTGGFLRSTAGGEFELPSKNGYRGLTIEHFDDKGQSLHKWMMYCTHPTLELNLAVKTVNDDKVSLNLKREVLRTILDCSATTKKAGPKIKSKSRSKTRNSAI